MAEAEPTFERLLAGCRQSAIHLETRDGYWTGDPAFQAWQENQGIDPLVWYAPWLDIVGAAVARGVTVRRARVVSEPVSDYVRFEYDITTALNVAAGEEVRWLPRRQASDLALPGNDFWVFDGQVVQLNHFSGVGRSMGHEVSTDERLVELCVTAFENVWVRAVPHAEYRPG